jgi:hypothetical protein
MGRRVRSNDIRVQGLVGLLKDVRRDMSRTGRQSRGDPAAGGMGDESTVVDADPPSTLQSRKALPHALFDRPDPVFLLAGRELRPWGQSGWSRDIDVLDRRSGASRSCQVLLSSRGTRVEIKQGGPSVREHHDVAGVLPGNKNEITQVINIRL